MSPSASLEMILALERAKMLQQQQQPPQPQPPQSAAAAALKAFTDRQGKKDGCSHSIPLLHSILTNIELSCT